MIWFLILRGSTSDQLEKEEMSMESITCKPVIDILFNGLHVQMFCWESWDVGQKASVHTDCVSYFCVFIDNIIWHPVFCFCVMFFWPFCQHYQILKYRLHGACCLLVNIEPCCTIRVQNPTVWSMKILLSPRKGNSMLPCKTDELWRNDFFIFSW